VRALHLGAIVAVAAVLCACNPQVGSQSGGVRLDYVSTSESVALFTLENRSAGTIKISGSRRSLTGIDLYRGDYFMRCTKNGESEDYRDGFRDPPEFAEIRSGESVNLRVHGDLTQRYKSGRCHLELMPMTGGTLESSEFAP